MYLQFVLTFTYILYVSNENYIEVNYTRVTCVMSKSAKLFYFYDVPTFNLGLKYDFAYFICIHIHIHIIYRNIASVSPKKKCYL